jgi:hypothetical protein
MPVLVPINFRIFGHYDGLSFFIFVFYYKHCREKTSLINHEKIHFYQQLEMLFVLHWLLYGIFYLRNRLRGHTHDKAYRLNPFEEEAYANELNASYLRSRKPFAWTRFI